ncbi:MAG: peroxiredoxin [Candidatus Marinimicrobia bacterium]|nr:peroxiredoxin [Candidatus Neomarinimicrobiota bacterium]MDP7513238.1 peroxiredoxin [Candidatus Neomarinimicrobiota bacterium]HJL63500.1 peroxiredoxin [Candidatus Neomarinimicrobiota bacterium]|tara:strand:+ start:85 stop:585 length:501 start_codon:yes stop_codon:yes gene_type:complete
MLKFFTLSVIMLGFLWGKSMPISVGEPAPEFSLSDENGKMHSLSQYRGQKIVVYFYPKDDTPGCTKEACGIRDEFSSFVDNQIVVFGISYDNASSHRKFKKKFDIPFHLLSDENKSVSKLYGADGTFFPSRKTYLIDEDGKLLKIYDKVNVLNHAEDILRTFAKND